MSVQKGEIYDNRLIKRGYSTPRKWLLKHRGHTKRLGTLTIRIPKSYYIREFLMFSCDCGEFFISDEIKADEK